MDKNFKGFNGLSNDDWLIDDMQSMKKSNLDIYKNNKDSKITTPNPNATASTLLGSPLHMVDSLFIRTGMGPNATINTMFNDIESGLRTTEQLSNQAYLI